MENNESKTKSQPTGGLKLMTVFIAVIALHVVIIGSFAVYHLMNGGTTDADLLADKTHKGSQSSVRRRAGDRRAVTRCEQSGQDCGCCDDDVK